MIDISSKTIGEDIYFMGVYGSTNYNAMDDGSDIDWRGFIRYRDDDTKILRIGKNDICINGVNQFKDMIHDMNPRAIELLFSDVVEVNQNLPPYIRECINKIFELKHKIVAMDTLTMFDSYILQYEKHMILAEKHPYSYRKSKFLRHAFRLINTLERFYNTNFTNYDYAIRYEDQEIERHFINSIEKGFISVESLKTTVEVYYEKTKSLRGFFDRPLDKDTFQKFKDLAEEIGGEY